MKTKIKSLILSTTIIFSFSITANELKNIDAVKIEESTLENYFQTNNTVSDGIYIENNYVYKDDLIIPISELKLYQSTLKYKNKVNIQNQNKIVKTSYSSPISYGYRKVIALPKKSDVTNITVNFSYYTPQDWLTATVDAMEELNSWGADFSFNTTFNNNSDLFNSNSDIFIKYTLNDFGNTPTLTAKAKVGTYQEGVGNIIYLNALLDSHSHQERVNIMIHEFLHTLGYHHRGTNDGVKIPGTDKWYMWCTKSVMDSTAKNVCLWDDNHMAKVSFN